MFFFIVIIIRIENRIENYVKKYTFQTWRWNSYERNNVRYKTHDHSLKPYARIRVNRLSQSWRVFCQQIHVWKKTINKTNLVKQHWTRTVNARIFWRFYIRSFSIDSPLRIRISKFDSRPTIALPIPAPTPPFYVLCIFFITIFCVTVLFNCNPIVAAVETSRLHMQIILVMLEAKQHF